MVWLVLLHTCELYTWMLRLVPALSALQNNLISEAEVGTQLLVEHLPSRDVSEALGSIPSTVVVGKWDFLPPVS